MKSMFSKESDEINPAYFDLAYPGLADIKRESMLEGALKTGKILAYFSVAAFFASIIPSFYSTQASISSPTPANVSPP